MFFGLDFETSGTNPEEHAPIQVGVATLSEVFVRDIGKWNWHDDPWTSDTFASHRLAKWDPEAEAIHGITKERLKGAMSSYVVDGQTADWVRDLGSHRAGRIAVGWNVASFDFAFLRKWLPETASEMSYRSVDLNAVVFHITHTTEWKYNDLKDHVKGLAAHRIQDLGIYADNRPLWHDAGYDAIASLLAWEELKAITRGEV